MVNTKKIPIEVTQKKRRKESKHSNTKISVKPKKENTRRGMKQRKTGKEDRNKNRKTNLPDSTYMRYLE